MNKDEINNVLKLNTYHVFYRGKTIKELQTSSVKHLKEIVKTNIEAPKKNKRVVVVRLKYEGGNLFVSCVQMTITPDLFLINDKDDYAITAKYTAEDLEDYGFDRDGVNKIINALKKRNVDLSKSIIDVEDIFNN